MKNNSMKMIKIMD